MTDDIAIKIHLTHEQAGKLKTGLAGTLESLNLAGASIDAMIDGAAEDAAAELAMQRTALNAAGRHLTAVWEILNQAQAEDGEKLQ